MEGFERLRATLDRAVADREQDFETRIVRLGRAYVRFATKNSALIGLMFAAKHDDDAPAELIAVSERAFAAGPLTIAEGQKAGVLVNGDPPRLALPIFAAFEGLVAISHNGMFQGIPIEELVVEVVQRIIVGLQPR